MTKKEIARLVYENTHLNLVDSQVAVQATFESIIRLLVKFGRVELRGFGVFKIQQRAGRQARNPRTGEEVWVDEHSTVVFRPSKLMKEEVQVKRSRATKKTKKAAAKAAPVKAAKSAKAASVKEVAPVRAAKKSVKRAAVAAPAKATKAAKAAPAKEAAPVRKVKTVKVRKIGRRG